MYVYAATTAALYEAGLRVMLEVDQVWDANDPIVKARPELFNSHPTKVHRTTPDSVEQATAVPGEKRTVRRDGR